MLYKESKRIKLVHIVKDKIRYEFGIIYKLQIYYVTLCTIKAERDYAKTRG